MKLFSFHLFSKTFCYPPLKLSTCCKIGSHVLGSWYYVEKYQSKRVTCHCYQKLRQINFFKKNFGKCSQIGCFKVRNSTWKTLTLWQSLSSNIFLNKSFMGDITGNLENQSPLENMHKLFDCITTPLKRFSACLIFHRKEIQLRHLHKRTNTKSAHEYILIYLSI